MSKKHPIQADEVENIERLVNQGLNLWVEEGHAVPHAFYYVWEYDYAEGDTRVFDAFKTCQDPVDTLNDIVGHCVRDKYHRRWNILYSGASVIDRPNAFNLQYFFRFGRFRDVWMTVKFRIDDRGTDNERAYATIKLQGGPRWPGRGARPTDLA